MTMTRFEHVVKESIKSIDEAIRRINDDRPQGAINKLMAARDDLENELENTDGG